MSEHHKNSKSTEGLKPCPFCGGSALATTYSGSPTIFCRECPSMMGGEESTDSQEVLQTAWNRRAVNQFRINPDGSTGMSRSNAGKVSQPKTWLIYYKQRRFGTQDWIEANALSKKHPSEFLLQMREAFESHESLVMWAMEVPDPEVAEKLSGHL